MKKQIYIAGPMTGRPSFNFAAFDAARDKLMAEGWQVVSPADLDRAVGFDPDFGKVDKAFLESAMRRDIEAIMRVHAIYMLDGWEQSTGAKAELGLAKWRHIEVIYQTVKPADPAKDERNPKDVAGSVKCPMNLLPPVALEQVAWVHKLGNDKYGPFNWRGKPIGSSAYVAAIMRHLMAWHAGEDMDGESGKSHLAHIGATANILMDAEHCGTLIDDRPKKP